jgi:hypothetical protein
MVASAFMGDPVNYKAFSGDSLLMMYESVRGGLGSDDALSAAGKDARFRVREHPNGRRTLPTLRWKCSVAGWCST